MIFGFALDNICTFSYIYLVHVFAASGESILATYLKLERHAEKIEIKNRDTHILLGVD